MKPNPDTATDLAGTLRQPRKLDRFLRRRWAWIVAALLFVVVAIKAPPVFRQYRTIKHIEALGGRVGTEPGWFWTVVPSEWRTWFEENLGTEWLESIESIIIGFQSSTPTCDADLRFLEQLPQLQVLYLDDTQVTDAGLIHLKGLTALRSLSLSETQVTDAGVIHLKGMTGLQSLLLNGMPVTDAGLIHLKGMTGLQYLSLHDTQVTDAGVADLRVALPKCEIMK